MKPEDFKAALDWCARIHLSAKGKGMTPEEYVGDFPHEHFQVMSFALRLAEKVLSEPSVAAIDAAKAEFKKLEKACNEVGERLSWEGGAMVVHQSMISQAVKEIEG